jgi:hypothetical protein
LLLNGFALREKSEHANTYRATRIFLALLSDAPEDSWIPGARYVQARGRRGGERIGERELSAAETVRFAIYNHNRALLGELDPQNPLLTTQYVTTRDWFRRGTITIY